MKKKLIYSSALAALLSASSIALAGGPEIIPIEDYFSGLYVGGTGSVHHASLDGSSSIDLNTIVQTPGNFVPQQTLFNTGNISSIDSNGASVDGYGGIQGGFGWTFNHVWYLGVQGFGEFGSQSDTNGNSNNLVNATVNFLGLIQFRDVANVSNTTTVKIGNDYGVAAKLGYVVAPKTLVYGKIGASWANIKVSNTSTATNNFAVDILPPLFPNVVTANTVATASSSSSSDEVGLLLGIGAEQFIYQDIVSLNIEYDYVNYGSVSTGPASYTSSTTVNAGGVPVFGPTGPNTIDIVTSSATGSATVNSILGGINFYFGRNWF